MKVENINPTKLIPYEFNNKMHDETQVNRIANSIKEFWFTQPVVIDNNNVIIIWHGRVEASIKLWLKEVPCVRMENLTEKQVKKLRILDNKLNESDWNLTNLKLDLDELWDLDFGDLKISIWEMFPEIDFPVFNPDDISLNWEHDDTIKITVFAKDEAEAEMIRNDLTNLGYNYK